MADPLAALIETRRVLRPGGRLALAVWDAASVNPWALIPMSLLRERGLLAPLDGDRPGPFALGDPGRVRALLLRAGFVDPLLDAIDVAYRHESFDAFWETMLDVSREAHDAVLERPAREIERLRAELAERLAPYTGSDGSLTLPGRSLVALAAA
jgi:SAM-dependent methyltransferase